LYILDLHNLVTGCEGPTESFDLVFAANLAGGVRLPRARARARQVVTISELVFGALTQSRSSLEDRTTTRRADQVAEDDGALTTAYGLEAVVSARHMLHLRGSCFDVRLLSGLRGLQ
jgi:hypothetical protein